MLDRDSGALLAENQALTARVRELEHSLAQSRSAAAFLESAVNAAPVVISRLDPELKVRFVNHYYPGYTPETTLGRSVLDFIAPGQHATVLAQIALAQRTGEITSYSLENAAGPHGAPASYLVQVAPVPEPDGRTGVCLAAVDITGEKRRERSLRETQEKLDLARKATGLGLWSMDMQSHEAVWDESMRALHGWNQPLAPAAYLQQLVHPEDREWVQRAMQESLSTDNFGEHTYRILRPDGSIRWVLTTGKAVRDEQGAVLKLLGGTLDVTHTRELEEQVRQSQKLEAIGSLAAGIAHNFNNMLAVIVPTLEIVEPRVGGEHERLIRHARHAAQRAAELVRELMTYAGHSASHAKVSCNLDSLVDEATEICRRTFAPHIELAVEHLFAPTPVIQCNPVQIEQVLVNLLLNARDAILEASAWRGRVRVRVRAAEPSSLGGQDAVCIDVTDDGIGMDEQTRARVFEPFFTTKGVGKGTGLGLATSYAIVRDHQGSIRVSSSPGQGSTFTITLPRAPVRPSLLPAQPEKPPKLNAKVLLVDDDEHVRSTLEQVLAHAGLEVHVANSGESALRALLEAPDTEVILLDRAMPGGSGERFVPRMREICPRARIAFLSGQITEEALSKLADAVIPKPITGSALLRAIAELVERR